MGKAGRFACIFVPMGLSIASLVCIVLALLGQQSKGGLQSSIYFFKADLSNFTANPANIDTSNIPDIPGTTVDNNLLAALTRVADAGNLKDFYQVGLWNYCDGEIQNGNANVDFCSDRKANFWFNPVEVWGLNGTSAQELFPKELNDGLNVYKKVAGWMFTAYIVALCLTIGEILLGFLAIFSRWGSFITTIVSAVSIPLDPHSCNASSIFTIAAALTSTILYASLTAAVNTALKPYNIHASLGNRMLSIVWLAVAFSLGAGLFWTFSVCCCSGKSSSPANRRHFDRAEKGQAAGMWGANNEGGLKRQPTNVFNVGSGYQKLGGGEQHQMHDMSGQSAGVDHGYGHGQPSPYESYRHQ
ncbi:hypothetical protein K402DRAFT_439749 [Aulographum hederae CBS 113979]|uniref:Integral membrane protein n=1 Tax=Aulographum hederae CBS 113979 TaxID=1176131 RepID=A0A6G1HBC6_9PEZI|nr:hypothetical protein K402DRAFT_439749 [Aulographum hederae CBS 113979]